MRWLLLLPLLLALAVAGLRYLPPEWDPRAPLDLAAEPNLVTDWKLGRLARQPEACFAALAAGGLPLSRVPDRSSEAGCETRDALRLASPLRALPPGPVVTCRLNAAWAMFERHTLQPAARRLLGSEVAGIRHFGTQACRNVNHAATGPRSRHATADAIDLAGLVLRDGREIRVARDWSGTGPEAAFLRAIHAGACRWFGVVLGPGYNAAHRDHIHLDMGPWRACR